MTTNFLSPVPAGAFNPALLANPLLYKVQAPPPMIPQATVIEPNGFVPKDLTIVNQPLSPTLPVKQQHPMHFNHHVNSQLPANNGPLPGALTLNNNMNSNNTLQSSRDELPWPKLIVSISASVISRLIIYNFSRSIISPHASSPDRSISATRTLGLISSHY